MDQLSHAIFDIMQAIEVITKQARQPTLTLVGFSKDLFAQMKIPRAFAGSITSEVR
jgi:hypothetical protein